MKQYTALIPVREYDEVMRGKNILAFGDTNLLTHKIRQLKSVPSIDEIIVSSENNAYLEIAVNEGVAIDQRPSQHSQKNCDFGDFVAYIASKIDSKNIIWAAVTSPLVDAVDYEHAIQKYKEIIGNGYDSLITVNKLKRFLLDENGPLNFRSHADKRNQSKLPELYEFTNGVVIAPTKSMERWKYNWGHMPYKYELGLEKSIDICNQAEYEYAKFLFFNQAKLST